jgi:hypothetical protein
MAEIATAPAAVDPKTTSANIVKGVTDKAAGKPVTAVEKSHTQAPSVVCVLM